MRDIEYEHDDSELELSKKRQAEIRKIVLLEHIRNDPYWQKSRKNLIRRKYGR